MSTLQNRGNLLVCLLVVAALCAVPQVAQSQVFVSPDGDNTTGDSWAAAYTSIQAGIDDADALDEEVWVAGGAYAESLTMRDGVSIYGGFAGNEIQRSERDPALNVSTIDASTADAGNPAD